MECKDALPLLHEYVDRELPLDRTAALKEHLKECAQCKKKLIQLEKVDALIKSWPETRVSEGLTERIMQALPPAKKSNPWYTRVRKYPGLSAAAVFVFLMTASFVTLWDEDKEMLVKGSDLQSIKIEGDTVIVPKGSTVAGDLTVSNGKLQVEGEVQGNLIVIDGSIAQASTAHISGKVTQIDEAFSWLWFKVNDLLSKVTDSK